MTDFPLGGAGIPLLSAQQATAEVTANAALAYVERVSQISVVSGIGTNNDTPPGGTPADGVIYQVGSSPTGAWAGNAGKLALYFSGRPTAPWIFITRWRGMIAEDQVNSRWYRFNGSAWKDINLKRATATFINPSNTLPQAEAALYQEDKDTTIRKMVAVVRGTTPSVTWTVKHHTSRDSGSPSLVVTAGTTTTSTSTGSVVTSGFNDNTVLPNAFVWAAVTAATGSGNFALELHVFYTDDA